MKKTTVQLCNLIKKCFVDCSHYRSLLNVQVYENTSRSNWRFRAF